MDVSGLKATDLHFSYNGREVLAGVDLHLNYGEILSLLGPNGAGKSTLLRLLLGLSSPHGGRVTLDEQPLSALPRRVTAQKLAYVPQIHVTPFPYRVRDVVMMGRLPITGLGQAPGQRDRERVEAALDLLGIAHLADRPYTEISGGERQITLIGRALVQEARLLILDEPATGLDYGNAHRMLALMEKLAASGYGILMTTHHPDHAMAISSRIAVLDQGRIRFNGSPAEIFTPELIWELYGVAVEIVPCGPGRIAMFGLRDQPQSK